MKSFDGDPGTVQHLPAAQRGERTQRSNGDGSPPQAHPIQAVINHSPRQLAQRSAIDAVFQQVDSRQPVEAASSPAGLPAQLKAGVEALSGMDMSTVRVHRNSSKPAQLHAHAYAQGHDIHLAPGQEQHLPHEAWHVVQQSQGRVKQTMQMAGVEVNDDKSLEEEADVMGARAASRGAADGPETGGGGAAGAAPLQRQAGGPAQLGRKGDIGGGKRFIKLVLPGSGDEHWRTHTEQRQETMVPLPSATGQLAWVRQAEAGDVEFTIAGPQMLGGAVDRGANSIQSNIDLAVPLLLVEVQALVDGGVSSDSIVILIKAHSRNAVAASQISQHLVVELYQAYTYAGMPSVEVVMFDPVPGPGQSGERVQTDVGIVASSTLVYSRQTQHSYFFDPQVVLGAQRVIVSLQDHGTGTESSFNLGGQIYKGSALNSLPPGLYRGISWDAQNRVESIARVRSTGELESTLDEPTVTTQQERINTIRRIAEAFDLIQTPATAETKVKID